MKDVTKELIRVVMVNQLDGLKDLMLTKNDLVLLDHIEKKLGVTASQAAKFKNSSVVNASTKLKRLYDQGYLQRESITSPTGGFEFFYHTKNYKVDPICSS